jgi:hypothetical protein
MQDAYVQNLANRVATDTDGVHAVLRSSSLTMMELQSGRSPCVTICVVTAPLVGRIRECRVRDGLPTPGVQPSSRGLFYRIFSAGTRPYSRVSGGPPVHQHAALRARGRSTRSRAPPAACDAHAVGFRRSAASTHPRGGYESSGTLRALVPDWSA